MVDPVGPNFVVGTFFFFLDGIDGVLSVLGVEEVVDDDSMFIASLSNWGQVAR